MRATRYLLLAALAASLSSVAAPPRIAGCQVFTARNAWNTPVDTLRPHSLSDSWVATIGATRSLHPDFGTFYLGAPIGIPFISVTGSQPLVPVTFTQPGESDPGPYPIPPGAPIEGGSASTGDRHVLVLERDSCSLYELYSAMPQGGGSSWSAYSGAWFDLGSNALRPNTWTSADAAGLPILPGLVRYDEVVAGEIAHAIRFTAPQTRNAHAWPARHDASNLTGTQYPPMGARFRLKAGVDISPFSAQNQSILRALKKYGMILADNGSAWFISGEHNTLWDDAGLSALGSLKGSDFEAVDVSPMVMSPSSAQAFQPPPAVTLREVATGLNQPLEIVSARDGSGRLFIVEKPGRIRILKNGSLLPTPFLDLSAQVSTLNERGLLGLAFHPQFAANRRFFVYYTALPDDGTGGSLRISSFTASAANPDLANPASESVVITIAHPTFSNHNGGHIAFGPDGFLYAGTGDGGSGGDPANSGQSLTTLLGKLLRLDVSPASGYLIPPGNPFVTVAGARPEIWAYGLRNPWKFSFDRGTGDLLIADVGQGAVEEVDFVPAGTVVGNNFGWRVFEGTSCFNPATGCALANHTPPVLVYNHDAVGGNSITGGYVYRGSRSAALRGYYIFGDFGSNRVWAAPHEGNLWTKFVLVEPPSVLSGITSFGEDEAGEIYVASISTGKVHAIDGPVTPSSNVALATAGAVASASSVYGASFPPSAVNNGDRAGLNWGGGSGWNDATLSAYPDWVQIDFNGTQSIDRVVVYTLQDNNTNPSEPTDTMTFTSFGVVDFTVQGWNGSSWATLGTVTNNNLVKRTVTFTPFDTSRIRINVTRAMGGYSHLTEVEAWGNPAPGGPVNTNVALASAGGSASASSAYSGAFPASAAINGDRAGLNWGNGSGWNDGTMSAYPDWAQVNFGGSKTIDRVVVYTLQDNVMNPSEPTDTMTFTSFGIVDFAVQGWTGSAWMNLGTVTGNNLVKRTVTFAPFTTDRIRINVTRALAGYSHITEIEAWGVAASAPPSSSNVALASAGGVASASSAYSSSFPAPAAINNERAGTGWGMGSGWNDGTAGLYPDWLQVDFSGTPTLDRVVVYTLQDNVMNPSEPTDTMTFTSFGIVDFTVQGWNGSSFVTLGTVTNNNLVKRTVNFAAFATSRIRINVTRALGGYSHITEVEAWGN